MGTRAQSSRRFLTTILTTKFRPDVVGGVAKDEKMDLDRPNLNDDAARNNPICAVVSVSLGLFRPASPGVHHREYRGRGFVYRAV
jgi:hypothetical protein